MPGMRHGIVAGWLKHGKRGPVLGVARAPAGLVPGSAVSNATQTLVQDPSPASSAGAIGAGRRR